ncbi:MAG: hypothetical protein KIT83_12685 [Bryobacterales bacterium]|nr:hypothetical protein [Bryobacterales bacterium]
MFDFRKIVLALVVLALAIPMVSAQEAIDNQPFNCRATSTPPLVRIEGVAELGGDILIVCSGIVPNQGNETVDGVTRIRDLRANITVNVDVPVTSRALAAPDINGRILTESLIINSGNQGRCGASEGLQPAAVCAPVSPTSTTAEGTIGQGAPYVGGSTVFDDLIAFNNRGAFVARYPNLTVNNHGKFATEDSLGGVFSNGTLEWDNVLLAPGSAAGRQWYMQMKITNIRVNAATLAGQGEFAPAINAIVTLNTTTGTVPLTPDTVVIARPRPSFRITSEPRLRRNCDSPRILDQDLLIIELLPNAFKPRLDNEVVQNCPAGSVANRQCNPNTAYFTESGLMVSTPETGYATQGTQFNIAVTSPGTLDNNTNDPYNVNIVSVLDDINDVMTGSVVVGARTPQANGSVVRNFTLTITDFLLSADPFTINRVRVRVRATYNEQVYGSTAFQVWYLPLANLAGGEGIVKFGAPVPRFAPVIKDAQGYSIVRCRTLLLFPYLTNRDGYNTGIAIANTSKDDGAGPFDENKAASDPMRGANPQTGPCTLYLYGGNNGAANPVSQTPLFSTVNVRPGGMYLMTLQDGGVVKGPAGQDDGALESAPGFQGYGIASCEFQYAHGYAFISDVNAQQLAQGYLALIIPDRTGYIACSEDNESEYCRNAGGWRRGEYEERPASPFNLGAGAELGGEQLVH